MLLCVDFGSTFTKAVLVDLAAGRLLATVQHPTTRETDLLDGLARCRDVLASHHPGAASSPALACSSAGGGLRIAVVGNEALVTAEAGRRVALSSGGIVVGVFAAQDRGPGFDAALAEVAADVVLLVGGTDGGDDEEIVAAAARLVAAGWTGPVVVAGNREAAPAVGEALAGLPVRFADNLLPRIGVLDPEPARRVLREVFLEHVIGGKQLSRGPEFARMLLGPTPDVILSGVELLAEVHGGTEPGTGVVVVDVGGATTDVYSVLVPDPEESELGREVVATVPATRTVEGDLGMRWSAPDTVRAAGELGLLDGDARDRLAGAAERCRADPARVPADEAEWAEDLNLAAAALGVAVRRHAGRARVVLSGQGRVVERTGIDLRAADLLVGSGGVLRSVAAAAPDEAARVLSAGIGPDPEGWQLPEHPAVVIDRDYALAAAGLLVAWARTAAARGAGADRSPGLPDAATALRVARGLLGEGMASGISVVPGNSVVSDTSPQQPRSEP